MSLLPAPDLSPRQAWQRIFLFTTLWTIAVAGYSGLRQLTPDEAYYWTWSRHLAGGYLDHPPMVALMIRAGTSLFGDSEFAVRFFSAIFTAATVLVIARIAHRLAGPAAALWSAIILLASPLATALAMITTPDTPAFFFTSLALLAAISIFLSPQNSPRRTLWWLALGAAIGLGMFSKYTAVLIAAAIALAILSAPQGRAELKRPGPWLALITSFLCFSPTILWNAAHNFASFRFQLSHGLSQGQGSPALRLLTYLPGQALIWTPILMIVTLIALFVFWRRLPRLDVPDRILLFSATFPLLFFWYSSFRHSIELNWPATAYLPATVLLVRYVLENPQGSRRKWTEIGLAVAACSMIVLHVPELCALTPRSLRIPGKWGDLYGWRELAQQVDAAAPPGAVVYCSTYESAAEITFYRPGHPQAWLLDSGRPSAFDFFTPPPPDPSSQSAILYVRNGPHFITPGAPPPSPPPAIMLQQFPNLQTQWHEYLLYGHSLRWRQFILGQRNN